MHSLKGARWLAIPVVLFAVGALLFTGVSSASAVGPHVKGPSAPVFASKDVAKAKQGKPLAFVVKTKANPTASLSVVGSLPPNMTFVPDDENGTGTLSDPTPLGGTYTVHLQASNSVGTTDQTLTLTVTSKLPLIRHVFVIMMENNDYSALFGNPSADPYLATTLPSEGALLEKYYATGHFSNDNYTAFISGQPPNQTTRPIASAAASPTSRRVTGRSTASSKVTAASTPPLCRPSPTSSTPTG